MSQEAETKEGTANIRLKKRKHAVEDDASIPAEEVERRRRQRELRAIALQLRSKGEEYNPKRFRRQASRQLAARAGGMRDGHKPRRASTVQLILVPIFWNRKEEEKSLVLKAVGEAQAVLRAAGIACDTDTTHKLTPGQKYRHWEEKGVMLRVECKAAGEVAQKQELAVGPQLVDAVCSALGMAPAVTAGVDSGATKERGSKERQRREGSKSGGMLGARGNAPPLAAGNAACADETQAPVRKTPKKAQRKSEVAEALGRVEPVAAAADLAKPPPPLSVPHAKPKLVIKSGDELEGDFESADLLGSQQQPGGKKAKKKQKKLYNDEAMAEGAVRLTDWPEAAAKKQKKGKVVKF